MNNHISRREFSRKSAVFAAAMSVQPLIKMGRRTGSSPSIRLGAPLFAEYNSPDEWVKELKRLGYRAANCPVGLSADDAYILAGFVLDLCVTQVVDPLVGVHGILPKHIFTER